IAESGHYPAIDVEASISRAMHEIASPQQVQTARQFRQILSTYQQNRDLIAIGAYARGSDPRIDAAIALWPRMQRFLQQDLQERADFAASLTALQATLAESDAGGATRGSCQIDGNQPLTTNGGGAEGRRRPGAAPRPGPRRERETRSRQRGQARRAREVPRRLPARFQLEGRRGHERRQGPRLPGVSRAARRSSEATGPDRGPGEGPTGH